MTFVCFSDIIARILLYMVKAYTCVRYSIPHSIYAVLNGPTNRSEWHSTYMGLFLMAVVQFLLKITDYNHYNHLYLFSSFCYNHDKGKNYNAVYYLFTTLTPLKNL